jgi:Na+-transporting methylmalonyl-CoA/oxaloacetate decarboxylase beta subunit
MKKKLLILGNLMGMIAFLAYTAIMIGHFFGAVKYASGLSIIGGADGPTAVFVSSPYGPFPLVLSLFLFMLLDIVFIANILYLLKNRK